MIYHTFTVYYSLQCKVLLQEKGTFRILLYLFTYYRNIESLWYLQSTNLLSLSLCSPYIFVGLFLRQWLFFYSIFLSFLEQVSPNTSATTVHLQGSTYFVGFNKFPPLMCWCTVIHCYQSQEPTLCQRVRWGFYVYACEKNNECKDTGPSKNVKLPSGLEKMKQNG